MSRMGDLAATDVYNAFDVPLDQGTNVGWANRMGEILTARPTYDESTIYKTASPLVNISEGDIGRATEAAMGVSGGGMSVKGVKGMYGVGDPTQTGWVFKDVAYPHKHMEKGDWRAVTRATDTGEGIANVELPIRSLNATQKAVNPDFADVLPRGDKNDAPFVIKKNGQFFVQDGHHRLTAAAESGKQTANVRLVDLDGTTQTAFPLVDLMKKYGIAGAAPTAMGALAAQDQYRGQ